MPRSTKTTQNFHTKSNSRYPQLHDAQIVKPIVK
jgi:hypothetical protein